MNLFFGILLLVISISLFSLLLYLFMGKAPFRNAPRLLFADLTTDENVYLLRIVPMGPEELPGFVRLPLHMTADFKLRLEAYLKQLLQRAVPDYITTEESAMFRVVFFNGTTERLRAANYPAPSFKEILIIRTVDKITRKAGEHIKLGEDLIPHEIGPMLWRYLVIDKAEELFKLIDSVMSGIETSEEEFREWLEGEDIERLETNRAYVRHICDNIRKGLVPETDIMRTRMEELEKEQVRMLQNINGKAAGLAKDKLGYSDEDFEDEVLKITGKYEGALNVYIAALSIRLISAVLGSLAPLDRDVTKQRVDDCLEILDEESGQLTTFLKIMEGSYGEQFFGLSPAEPAGNAPVADMSAIEMPVTFSINYPSYLLCELMRWYKKHWVMERAADIRARFLAKFGSIDGRINGLAKAARDAGLYTESPIKESLSFIIAFDASGFTRLERVRELHEAVIPSAPAT